jgi:hypothetical protein
VSTRLGAADNVEDIASSFHHILRRERVPLLRRVPDELLGEAGELRIASQMPEGKAGRSRPSGRSRLQLDACTMRAFMSSAALRVKVNQNTPATTPSRTR